MEGITLNRRKPEALLTNGILPEHLMEEQHTAIDSVGLTAIRQGMQVIRVLVGTEQPNWRTSRACGSISPIG